MMPGRRVRSAAIRYFCCCRWLSPEMHLSYGARVLGLPHAMRVIPRIAGAIELPAASFIADGRLSTTITSSDTQRVESSPRSPGGQYYAGTIISTVSKSQSHAFAGLIYAMLRRPGFAQNSRMLPYAAAISLLVMRFLPGGRQQRSLPYVFDRVPAAKCARSRALTLCRRRRILILYDAVAVSAYLKKTSGESPYGGIPCHVYTYFDYWSRLSPDWSHVGTMVLELRSSELNTVRCRRRYFLPLVMMNLDAGLLRTAARA